MVVNQYAWLLSILKIAYAGKRSTVELRCYSTKMISLLDVLLSVGYISNYRSLDKENLIIFLRYVNTQPVWKNVNICHHSSSDFSISTNSLKRYLKHDRKSIFILSTSIGLITGMVAVKSLNGGKLICILS